MQLSLNVIVKNEEFFLDGLLSSLGPLFDEVVVVDTGSTDETTRLARASNATVVDFKTSSLSEARNLAIEESSGDWVVCLDADHRVLPEDVERIRAYTHTCDADTFLQPIYNYVGSGRWSEYGSLRILRKSSPVRWSGDFHESLSSDVKRFGATVRSIHTPIRHLEYLGHRNLFAKRARNIERLDPLIDVADPDPHLLALASLDYFAIGETQCAFDMVRKAVSMMKDDPTPMQFLGQYALATGDNSLAEQSLQLALRAMDADNPDFGQVNVGLAQLALNAGRADEAWGRIELIRNVRPSVAVELNLASIANACGETATAKEHVNRAMNFETFFLDALVYRSKLTGSVFDPQITLLDQYDALISTEWFVTIRESLSGRSGSLGF